MDGVVVSERPVADEQAVAAIDRQRGTWRDLIRTVAATERSMLPYRRYPLTRIQRLAGRGPLFEVAFNFTDVRDPEFTSPR